MASPLGEKLKERRQKMGLTLDQLAELTKTSKSYLWELENRDTAPRPSAEKLGAIAEKLGVTISYFLDDSSLVSEESAADAHFYRKFRRLDEKDKEKLRKIIELWDDDPA